MTVFSVRQPVLFYNILFQSRNRIVETAAVEKQPVFQFLYPCNQSIEMEVEVFGGFIHMIIQDGMDGLIDLQF